MDALMAALRGPFKNHRSCLGLYSDVSIWENTAPTSILRRFILDQYAYYAQANWLKHLSLRWVPHDLLVDILKAVLSVRPRPTSGAPESFVDTCKYHEHDSGDDKCYKSDRLQ